MRKYISFLVIFFSVLLSAQGQSFHEKNRLSLPDTVTYESLSWTDFDNDTLLDLLVSGRDKQQQAFFLIFKNIGDGNFQYSVSIRTDLKDVVFQMTDFDQDNQIDIVTNGTEGLTGYVNIYRNGGSFLFEKISLMNTSADLVKLHDLNNDDAPELILSGSRSGKPFFDIYRNSGGWQLVNDSILVQATDIQMFDFDNDSDEDLFVSGIDEHSKPLAKLFLNEGDYYFKSSGLTADVNGKSSVSDLNHDGRLDIILAGFDEIGTERTILILGDKINFVAKDSLLALRNNEIFTGDFNSDGKCDISFFGTDTRSDTSNLILNASGTTELIPHRNAKTQSFGDFDRDGDLDLVQLAVTTEETSLSVFENRSSEENKAPRKPFGIVSAHIAGYYFLYWEKPEDDHTASVSLTYDVNLMTPGRELLSGSFDLITGRRLLVSHGNRGTTNYLLIKAPFSPVDYKIQSVDNAYHADAEGICTGGGSPTACQEFDVKTIEACKSETIELEGLAQTLWVSLTDGLVHKGELYAFQSTQSDTIFSVTPNTDGCDEVTLYNVEVKNSLAKSVREVKYVCEGVSLDFNAGAGWEQVLWSSDKRGVLSSESRIQYWVSEDDIVTLTTSDGSGCNLEKITELIVSKPPLQVVDSAYQIIQGGVVQLSASGGENFLWTPFVGLDNPGIANPKASPVSTTTYTVTTTDSIGCTASKRVLVLVEETAFIPTLFTPNEDGRNDELKVYGLSNAGAFNLSIYNREGSLVYSSNSVTEVTGRGWDGVSNGKQQPSGVYYWKVKGENKLGEKILLNGKSSGSVVLIR